jgi:hypothetical protein
MLPLAHDVRRQRAQHKQIDQSGQGDGGHGQQGVEAVLWGCETRDTQCLSTSASSQSHRHGQGCLQREVEGEDGGLQASKLRTRQGAESDNTTDKGL